MTEDIDPWLEHHDPVSGLITYTKNNAPKPKPKPVSHAHKCTKQQAMAYLAAERMQRAGRMVTAEFAKILSELSEDDLERVIAKFSSIPECGRMLDDLYFAADQLDKTAK